MKTPIFIFTVLIATAILAGGVSAQISVGATAPEFTLNDLSDAPATLSKLQGQVVVLDFWATWCPPCRVSLPHIQKMHEEFGDKGLTILAITNEPREKVGEFIIDHKYTFRTLLDANGEVFKQYDGEYIPYTIVLTPKGTVAEVVIGNKPEVLEAAVRAELGLEPAAVAQAAEVPPACELLDVQAVVRNGRTLVPARDVLEWAGAAVSWDARTRTLTAENAGRKVVMVVGLRSATVNGVPVNLDVPAAVINGIVHVPIRFAGEALGMKVQYSPEGVYLTSGTRCGLISL